MTTIPDKPAAAHSALFGVPGQDQPQHSLTGAAELIGEPGETLSGLFDALGWAEQEIERAQRQHPDQDDRLFHSFMLLKPTPGLALTERVYRWHCAELLARVAASHDTRPATAAEMLCALDRVRLTTPRWSSAAGLYMRLWRDAGFPEPAQFSIDIHHETPDTDAIDEHERDARAALAAPDRQLGPIDCAGLHHGDTVPCAYTASRQRDRVEQ